MTNIYASVEDVDRMWDGTILEADTERVAELLVFAHAMLRAKIPSIDAASAAGTVDTDLLRFILGSAVIRVLNNPRGILGASTGETSYYLSQSGADRYGGLYLDDDDLELIGLPLGGKARFGGVSVSMGQPLAIVRDEYWRTRSNWC